jgi:hypothetical protein
MGSKRRIGAVAVAFSSALAPGVAGAAPCQPGPEHPTFTPSFYDLTIGEQSSDMPTGVKPVLASHRIGIDGSFANNGDRGHDGVIPGSFKVTASGAPTTKRDNGYRLAIVPQRAGTVQVTFSWTESKDPFVDSPVPSCDGSSVVQLGVVEPRPTKFRVKNAVIDGPELALRVTAGFAKDGDASPITVRARAGTGMTPPRSGLKTLGSFAIDDAMAEADRRIGKGWYGLAVLGYTTNEPGDAIPGVFSSTVFNVQWATLDLGKRYGSLIRHTGRPQVVSRGSMTVEFLQRGQLRARLRTGVRCGLDLPGGSKHLSCRAPGLKLTH